MAKFVNKGNAKRPGSSDQYRKVIKNIEQDGVCPFCPENLDRYHGMPILVEGDFWLGTDNKYPYKSAKNHLLIIHKAHIETVEELSSEAWNELHTVLQRLLKLRKIKGGGFFMRFGDTRFTGATVSHLHAQITAGSGKTDAEPVITRVG